MLDGLVAEVEAGDRWRWLELCCSLVRGVADELSDIDCGIGYVGLGDDDVEAAGLALVGAVGEPLDVLVEVLAGTTATGRRFAVELRTGVQLDLVLLPAASRPGLPPGAVALVDKDGTLAHPWLPDAFEPRRREWTLSAWWALSDVAKYVRRASLFEAVAALDRARADALRLVAAARDLPDALFGLTALLDAEPPVLPDGIQETYALPTDGPAVLAAASRVADLLDEVGESTPWAAAVRDRLDRSG